MITSSVRSNEFIFSINKRKMSSEATQLPQKLQDLAEEIDSIKVQIDKMVQFAQMVSDNPMLFSKQEVESVNLHLRTLTGRRDQKTQALAEAVDLYRRKVLLIRATLAKRKVLLESIDTTTKVLTDNSDLMQTFAKGHAMLQKEMGRAETEIGGI